MMDSDSSGKFIISLTKHLQSLCSGYVSFDQSVEIIGHIYLNIDAATKVDYVLNEKIDKHSTDLLTCSSSSFHAQPFGNCNGAHVSENAKVSKLTETRNDPFHELTFPKGKVIDARFKERQANSFRSSDALSDKEAAESEQSGDDIHFDSDPEQNSTTHRVDKLLDHIIMKSYSNLSSGEGKEMQICERSEELGEQSCAHDEPQDIERDLPACGSANSSSQDDQCKEMKGVASTTQKNVSHSDHQTSNCGKAATSNTRKSSNVIIRLERKGLNEESSVAKESKSYFPFHIPASWVQPLLSQQKDYLQISSGDQSFDTSSSKDGESRSCLDVKPDTDQISGDLPSGTMEMEIDEQTGDLILKTGDHRTLKLPNDFVDSVSVSTAKHDSRHCTCEVCGKHFQNRTLLGAHRRKAHGVKKFKCSHCGFPCTSKGRLIEHTRVHTGDKPYQCETCGSEFTQSSSLNSHRRIHTGERPYKCEHCDMAFTFKTGLRNHSWVHTGVKPHACEICGARFALRGQLNGHKKRHSDVRMHLCDICGQGFMTRKTLEEHRPVHTGERPFPCEFCGMSFARLKTLKVHKRIHSSVKPYRCDICPAQFNQNVSLKSHKRNHHRELEQNT